MKALALDIGGTKIEGVIVNSKYKVLERCRVPTLAHESKKVVLNQILEVVEKMMTPEIEGVGFSIAGFLDDKGTWLNSPNIPDVNGMKLRKYLEKRIDVPIAIENDADCFALAEHRFGAGKGTTNMLGVIWGTGIGCGIIINNKLYQGSRGGAGEIGQMVIDSKKPGVHNYAFGDFEGWCSGPHIVARYKKAGGKLKNATADSIHYSREAVAKKQTAITLEKMGTGLANLCAIFNPDAIVLGGGVSNVTFYPEIRKAVKQYGRPHLVKNVKILKNKLGDSSGVLGAASLILHK